MNKQLVKSAILAGVLLQSLQAEESFFNFDKLTSTIGKTVNGLVSGNTDTNSSTVEKEIPKKKVAIVINPKRSPDGLFEERVLPEFEKMVKSGEIKSYSKGTRTFLSSTYTTVNFDVLTEDREAEKAKVASLLRKGLESNQDKSVSSRIGFLFAENVFFGDKKKYHLDNPYEGCLNKKYLEDELKDFQIVDVSQNPDYVLKVEVDTCLTIGEFESRYAEYRGIPIDKRYAQRDNNSSTSGDLVRGGVQTAAIANNTQGNNVGAAMAGVGLAVGAIDWLLKPSEKDLVRLKATFEGKNKKASTFFPTSYSWGSHDWGREIGHIASTNSIRVLGEVFRAWEKNDQPTLDKIPELHKEKDLLKAVAAVRDETAKKQESK